MRNKQRSLDSSDTESYNQYARTSHIDMIKDGPNQKLWYYKNKTNSSGESSNVRSFMPSLETSSTKSSSSFESGHTRSDSLPTFYFH